MTRPSAFARQWYPGRAWRAGAPDLVRLAARARRRRIAERFRTPGNAAAAVLQLIVVLFAITQLARVGGRGRIDPRWMLGAAGVIAVWVSVVQWRRRAARPPEENVWLVLGGDPRALVAAALLECAWVSALLIAAVTWIARPAIDAPQAVMVWALALASFTTVSAVVSAGTRAARRAAPAAGASYTREASRAAVRRAEPARGPLTIALRLAARTLGVQMAQTLAFTALAGLVLIPGIYKVEGPARAGIFAAFLIVLAVLAWSGSARARIGRQHAFLIAHRRQVPAAVWRSLAAGQALVIAGAAACAAALVLLAVPAWRADVGNWTIGALVIEWAAYSGLASFWLATGPEDALRALLLQIANLLLLLAVAAKAMAVGTLTSPLIVAPAALLLAAAALRAWSRPPLVTRHA